MLLLKVLLYNHHQILLILVLVLMVVFIMVVSLLEPIKDQARAARINLNCSSAGLSAGEAGTCIVTDTYLFAWVGSALAVGLGFLGARRFIAGGG